MRAHRIVGAGFAALVSATAMLTAAQAPPRIRTFIQTADGNWRTSVKGPDGKDVEWVYVPRTKFAATVSTKLTVIDAAAAKILYEYRIDNHATSAQQVAWLNIGPGVPAVAQVRRTPRGWEHDVQPGWAMLFGPGYPPSGIAPGSFDVVEIEARNLPGVLMLRAQGNVGVPQIPGELTEQQAKDLDALSKNSAVDLPGIGPVIPAGIGEPELTRQVLLARVAMHYAEPLAKYRHPHATDLIAAMRRSAQKTGDLGAVIDDLRAVRAIAVRPVSDPWHQDLSTALRVAFDLLIEGQVPLK